MPRGRPPKGKAPVFGERLAALRRENGMTQTVPFSHIGIRTLVQHRRDDATGDKVGYFGGQTGIPAIVPAGSIVVLSSLSFHRSGENRTGKMRRAYVTQYSPERIYDPSTGQLMHLGVPFLSSAERVRTQ